MVPSKQTPKIVKRGGVFDEANHHLKTFYCIKENGFFMDELDLIKNEKLMDKIKKPNHKNIRHLSIPDSVR